MTIQQIQSFISKGVSVSQNKVNNEELTNAAALVSSANKQTAATAGQNTLSTFQSVFQDTLLSKAQQSSASANVAEDANASLQITNTIAFGDNISLKSSVLNKQNDLDTMTTVQIVDRPIQENTQEQKIDSPDQTIKNDRYLVNGNSDLTNENSAINIPIIPLDGNVLVENPGQFSETGNAEADELVSRVMLFRNQTNMITGASIRDVASAQANLVSLGYDVGTYGPFQNGVDGILGEMTSAGLLKFQQDQGLKQTGTLTIETSLQLKEMGKPALDKISEKWQTELKKSFYLATDYHGTANPFWYISFIQGQGDNPETMANIDPVFKGRLASLAKDFGRRAEFGEGYRDLERQNYFYEKYLNGTGNLAAKPGHSKHNMGLAVDTASDWLQDIDDGLPVSQQSILSSYGLYKPLADAANTSHENWHIQPLEIFNNSMNN